MFTREKLGFVIVTCKICWSLSNSTKWCYSRTIRWYSTNASFIIDLFSENFALQFEWIYFWFWIHYSNLFEMRFARSGAPDRSVAVINWLKYVITIRSLMWPLMSSSGRMSICTFNQSRAKTIDSVKLFKQLLSFHVLGSAHSPGAMVFISAATALPFFQSDVKLVIVCLGILICSHCKNLQRKKRFTIEIKKNRALIRI